MIGETLSHFLITAKLGEGGMGQVYRAEDTRLGREVAIKVLPDAVAGDPERLARFEREAKVLASLNHPNIAGIHQIEEAGGKQLLVMELVEGEDLKERIARGPISVAAALPIALQIAEALEAAHEKGIIHRDLKPANVKITPDGQVKVLDFGLAKALDPSPGGESSAAASLSPTLTAQMTQAGVLLGTAAYMSPEQARGQEVGRQADVWAFGAILLEMLTGRKVFAGETVSDTLAAVLRASPDWVELPEETPLAVRRLLRRCLERDVKQRLHDIADARLELEEARAGGSEALAAIPTKHALPAPAWRRVLPWLVAGGMAVLAASVLWVGRGPAGSLPPVRKLQITEIEYVGLIRSFIPGGAIAPDGRTVAYVSGGRLWLRRLDEFEAREVPESTWESTPIWSPDSRWVAYPAGRRLWKAPIVGGEPKVVADLPTSVGPFGGGWREDDRILFTTGYSGLLSVTAQGGDVTTVLEPDPETEADFHNAVLLPDGKGVMFSIHRKDRREGPLGLWDGSSRKTLLEIEGQVFETPVYSPTGHLLFERSPSGRGLWAAPFSLTSLEITGEPFMVAPQAASPSVASDGTLVFIQEVQEALRELVWVDRSGKIEATTGVRQPGLMQPWLSPDGSRAAVAAAEGGDLDLWVQDLARGTKNRLTSGSEQVDRPSWSPDGRRIAYFVRANEPELHLVDSEGRSPPMRLATGGRPSWSPDGSLLVYELFGARGLWYLRLQDEGPAGEPQFILDTPGDESHPVLSPDGKLLAYDSDESGVVEVYITRFPDAEGRWQVSAGGGINPRWSPQGDELLFIDHEGRLMSARVSVAGGTPRVDAPARLFDGRSFGLNDGTEFAVGPDSRRFLLTRSIAEARELPKLLLVENWAQEYGRD